MLYKNRSSLAFWLIPCEHFYYNFSKYHKCRTEFNKTGASTDPFLVAFLILPKIDQCLILRANPEWLVSYGFFLDLRNVPIINSAEL